MPLMQLSGERRGAYLCVVIASKARDDVYAGSPDKYARCIFEIDLVFPLHHLIRRESLVSRMVLQENPSSHPAASALARETAAGKSTRVSQSLCSCISARCALGQDKQRQPAAHALKQRRGGLITCSEPDGKIVLYVWMEFLNGQCPMQNHRGQVVWISEHARM